MVTPNKNARVCLNGQADQQQPFAVYNQHRWPGRGKVIPYKNARACLNGQADQCFAQQLFVGFNPHQKARLRYSDSKLECRGLPQWPGRPVFSAMTVAAYSPQKAPLRHVGILSVAQVYSAVSSCYSTPPCTMLIKYLRLKHDWQSI